MDERVVVPSTGVVLVLVVGMAAGHLLMPALPGAGLATRAAFVAIVAAAGGVAGWRIARLRRGPGRPGAGAAIGAVLALLLAWAGYAIVHG